MEESESVLKVSAERQREPLAVLGAPVPLGWGCSPCGLSPSFNFTDDRRDETADFQLVLMQTNMVLKLFPCPINQLLDHPSPSAGF